MKNFTVAVLKADKNNIRESFSKAIGFLEKDNKNSLNAFYASDYKFIKDNHPQMFEKVKAFISEERLQPLAAWWDCNDKVRVSDEFLARNTLYSQKFFKKNFGKVFRTGYGKKIGNPLSSEILFRSGINCYVEEDSENPDGFYWIDSKNTYRVLGAAAPSVPVKDIDELTGEEATQTLDKYFSEFFATTDDIDAIADIDFSASEDENEIEKALLNCEILDAVNTIKNGKESKIKEINGAWKKLLASDEACAETAKALAKSFEDVTIDKNDIFETSSESTELVALKKCCGSNKYILRIRQTLNVSKKIVVKSRLLDTCFWVDIEPYEIRSFIIEDGTPEECNFIENIDIN